MQVVDETYDYRPTDFKSDAAELRYPNVQSCLSATALIGHQLRGVHLTIHEKSTDPAPLRQQFQGARQITFVGSVRLGGWTFADLQRLVGKTSARIRVADTSDHVDLSQPNGGTTIIARLQGGDIQVSYTTAGATAESRVTRYDLVPTSSFTRALASVKAYR